MPDIDTIQPTPEASSTATSATPSVGTSSAAQPTASPAPAKKRDEKYFLVPVIIQAENCLFKIPRHYLTRSSIFFRDMFSLDETASVPFEEQDGSSDERPVRLPRQIKKEEFKHLLRVLCPLTIPPSYDSIPKDGWIAVLKLSNMWQIHDARKMAIDRLTKDTTISSVERLELGKVYYVPSWIRSAYTQLVQQPNLPTPEEAEKIGFKSYIGISQLREGRSGFSSLDNQLAMTFKDELETAEYHDREFAALS